jgi:hypothetical protein
VATCWPVLLLPLLLTTAAVAQGPENLVRNSDFERIFLLGGPADGWRAGTSPASGENAARPGVGVDGGLAHVIRVPQEAPINWYTCVQSLGALPPGGQFTLSLYIRTEGVHDGAGAYAGVNYFSADSKRIGWTDTETKVTGTSGWVRVTQPFIVAAGATDVVLNLVVQGHGTAFFDRVQVEAGDAATDWAPREASAAAKPLPAGVEFTPSASGNVAILSDTIPPTGTASDPTYLRSLVEEAGYGCALLSADQLADPAVLDASRFDLLVLPYGASFPVMAADALLGFCRDGGSLFAFGGYPFDRLLAKQNGVWKDVADLTPDESKLTTLFDLAQAPAGWTLGGYAVNQQPAEAARGRDGQCLKLATPALDRWVTVSSPTVERSLAGSQVTAFWARADQDNVTLAFEWDEKDGSRWRSRVRLSKEWRLYAIAHAELEYWHDNPSKGRGGPGDRFRPDNAGHLAFGLTEEFLRGKQPYAVYIDRVMVGEDPYPAWRNVQLNSHYGGINPATFLEPSAAAISICDPSAPLSDVAYLAPSESQSLLPFDTWTMRFAAQGISATGQTAQGRAGAPLKARWQPIVDCLDYFQRLRGTAVAVMHNFAGEYAGTSWGYSGISNHDLFARRDSAGADLFRAMLRRLVQSAWLFDAQAEARSVRRGETAVFSVCVGNQARKERKLTVRLRVESRNRKLADLTQDLRLPAHRAQPLRFDWPVPQDTPGGLLTLSWELNEGKAYLDYLQAGAVVWDEKQLAEGPRLTYRDCYFSRGRGPEFLLGSQIYWGNMTITGTDPLRWDRQLQQMADSGIHIARSFMSMPWMHAPEGSDPWRGRDAMVQLAQAHGVSLFYSGVSWPTIDPAEVAERAKTATEAATRYRMSPAWFVDIVNEPSLHVGGGAADDAEFRAYLKGRYGSFDALRAAWGDELTEGSFDEVRLTPVRGEWASLRAVDTNRFMSYAMRRWTAETAQAVKAADAERLVSVGHLQGFGSNEVMWDPIEASYDMDFANRHYYGDPMQYGPELMQIDMRTLGKAPSTGEFGNTSHPGLVAHGVYAPEEVANWHFAYIAHTCFGLGGAFAASWHWQDPIEDIFPCGLLYADGAPRPRFPTYRNAGILFRSIRPRYEPPAVFFVIPTSHRFGNSKAAVEAAMNRSLSALISLHVDFGTVAEEQLASLPASAKALIWPVPFCPDDATYQSVLAFVRRGGALYVSGDLSYDRSRKRTRTTRLPELCGVEFVAERYRGVRYEPGPGIGVQPADDSPLASAVCEAFPLGPCIEVRPTTARVLARSGGTPVAALARVGEGTVLYVIDPVELHADPRGILAAFLEETGIKRHAVEPDVATLHSHRVSGEGGALAQVLFNLADEAQRLAITDLPVRLELGLAPKWGGAAIFDGRGALVAVEARSAAVEGKALFSGEASLALISLTGEDVRHASGLVLLPSGPGGVSLPEELTRNRMVSVGEVRNGRWDQYVRLKLTGPKLAIDGPMSRSLLIIGSEDDLPKLTERFVRERM